MNIEGLDYNTKREKLVLPEYGREIQNMVDYAMSIADREERQRCANTIVDIMGRMAPQAQNDQEQKQKLWDHLAIISGFKLDIDYPCDVSEAHKIMEKPDPVEYPMEKIPVRHYGHMVFELFERLKKMPDGPEYDELVRLTANQMKRDLFQWGHGSTDDEKVASDIAAFTGGRVQIDLGKFRFANDNTFHEQMPQQQDKKRNGRRTLR